jgi:D-alanyl-D-alanine carboxypeptidase (penicillin-binding protein 5/6)
MTHRHSSNATRLPVWLVAVCASVIAFTSTPAAASSRPLPARRKPRGTTTTTARSATLAVPKSWILVDLDTRYVLDQHDPHVRRRPASTVKLLTALTVERNLRPDARVTVSPLAASMPARKIGLVAGQTWPLDELLSSVLAVSANDAAVAIAEQSGHGLDGFATEMNDTARSLEMVDSPTLEDPAGLDDTFARGGGDWLSAWDLALAGRAALADPTISATAKTLVVRFDGPDGQHHRLLNHNKLLTRYAGATGLKTGYTRAAGNTLVATATRDGRTMLAVVLDAPDPYAAVTALFDRGFSTPVTTEAGPRLSPAVHLVPSPALRPASRAAVVTTHTGQMSHSGNINWPIELTGGATGIALLALARRRSRRHTPHR